MVGKDEVRIRVTADSSGVATGMRPAETALDRLAGLAVKTDQAIASIGGDTKIGQALSNARLQLAQLQDQLAEGFRLDPKFDARSLRLQIAEVRRNITELERQHTVPVDVKVDMSQLQKLQLIMDRIAARAFPLSTAGRALRIGSSAISIFQKMGGASIFAARGVGAVGVAAGAAAGGVLALAGAWAALGVATAPAAANMEAAAFQMEALTGSAHQGAAAMQLIRQFSEETGFAIGDVAAATQMMLVAGIGLNEMPKILETIGDVSAATGKSMGETALIFQQMLSKGQLYTQDLNQLVDRGIPAWDILSKKMHVSTLELRKMAEEGKLGRQEMNLLLEGLDERFGGTAVDRMSTLTAKVQDLRNDINLLAADIGKNYLPIAKDIVDLADDTIEIIDFEARAFGILYDQLSKFLHQDFFEAMMPNFKLLQLGVKWLNEHLPDLDKGTAMKWPQPDPEGEAVDQLQAEEDAARELERQINDLEAAWKDAIQEMGNIGGAHQARIDFLIDQDDLQEEIEKAIAGVNEKGTKNDIPPVHIPADITMAGIPDLTDEQQDLVSNLSAFAQQGLEEGARRAQAANKWGFEFDEKAYFRDLRGQLVALVQKAAPGMSDAQVQNFVTNILGLPPVWKIKPRLERPDNIQAQLDELMPKEFKLDPKMPHGLRAAMEAEGFGFKSDDELDGFEAPILPEVDPTTLAEANEKLERDRYVNLYVNPLQLPGGAGFGPFGGAGPLTQPYPGTPSADDRRTPIPSTRQNKFSADIYIDGRLVGTAPGRLNNRPGGKRRP